MKYEIVPFHEHQILTVSDDDKFYVVMKPIAESMQLAWTGQLERIKNHPALAKGMKIIFIPSQGGNQEMVCLELSAFNGWLVTLTPGKIADPIKRDLIIRYQIEAFDVLTNYFFGDRGKERRDFPNAHERAALQRETNRLMSLLLRQTNLEERRVTYEMLGQTLGTLNIACPQIEALGQAEIDVQTVTESFWKALRLLSSAGVEWNLHRKASQFCAFNIGRLKKLCAEHGVNLVINDAILSALKRSKSPYYLGAKTVNTPSDEKVHAWVFEWAQEAALIAA